MSDRNAPAHLRLSEYKHLRCIYILTNEFLIKLMLKYIIELPEDISVGQHCVFVQ